MNKFNENNEKHGYWEGYWSNSQLSYKGNYINGFRHGLWEEYYPNGRLWFMGSYLNGNRIGFWIINNETQFNL